jgi:ERCC4-type nuclease
MQIFIEVKMAEIIIDSKEPLSYKIQALESGDINFIANNKRVRIERKNYEDLLNSNRSNRLAIQLNQLKADCDFPILAITGTPNFFNLIDRCELRNLLLSIKLTGVIIERLDNEADYKIRLPELFKYFSETEHISLIPYRYSNPKLSALMWIPGIGYRTAEKMLSTWQDSLYDIYTAPKKAIEKIIGVKLADRFYSGIHKPIKQATKEDYDLWQ